MQVMKLVDKVDSAINKVRSLTHFISKKPREGPCTLKLKVLATLQFASSSGSTDGPVSHLNLCAVQKPAEACLLLLPLA